MTQQDLMHGNYATWETSTDASLAAADVLVLPVYQTSAAPELATSHPLVNEHVRQHLADSMSSLAVKGKHSEVTTVAVPKNCGVKAVVLVGLGEKTEATSEKLRRAFGTAGRAVTRNAVVDLGGLTSSADQEAAMEGMILGSYLYVGAKTAADEQPKERTFTFSAPGAELAQLAADVRATTSAVILARDLANNPSSHLYPASYAAYLEKLAPSFGVSAEVLTPEQLTAQGFGGIMAVGGGSSRGPRLVVLRYQGGGQKTVGLVGKGITFDTGGISLKPGANMDSMISDMAGSAAVAATIFGAAAHKLPLNVVAVLPLAENMPGGHAYRPGDVITHYGGLTDEILNTDAEGRLVLADAMVKAQEFELDYLIDVATLTGAQLVALGLRTTGVMGAHDFETRVAELGRSVGEAAWAMPLPEEIVEAVKSKVADLRNVTGNRNGGMLAAAAFLQKFVSPDLPWAHLDVAGPAWNTEKPYGYVPARGTGNPVRTLLAVLADIAANG